MPTHRCTTCQGLGLVRLRDPKGGTIQGGDPCPACDGVGLLFEVPEQVVQGKAILGDDPPPAPDGAADTGSSDPGEGDGGILQKRAAAKAISTKGLLRRLGAWLWGAPILLRAPFILAGAYLGHLLLGGDAGMTLVRALPRDALFWVMANRDWLGFAVGGGLGYLFLPLVGGMLMRPPFAFGVTIAAVAVATMIGALR